MPAMRCVVRNTKVQEQCRRPFESASASPDAAPAAPISAAATEQQHQYDDNQD
jgi:hypothetical protein